uniref:ChsH2 rubredoxin-like zinc ribbon domain-containing protein n=1 Tax=OCS116 cluster bacterium TaxID=2030921 RepID=A0A2A4Z047_9PROT
MSNINRPTPKPSAENLPFWEAAKAGKLQLAKCLECGRIPYPPTPRCPSCLSSDQSWIVLSGRATLRGWTNIHLDALPGHNAPICLVECALIEDPRSIIALIDESGSAIGAAPNSQMQITFEMNENGWAYPQANCLSEQKLELKERMDK